MTDKKVLTIQDISCYGQCSLTVALPIISACGVEAAILPSAVLSTHTGGFKGFTFRDLTDDMPAIKAHWKSENISFDAIYTGYLGSKRQIDIIKEFFAECLNDGGLRIVDPAMADNGKLYTGFDMAYVEEMKTLIGYSDIFLPNITEACFLTGIEYRAYAHDEEYIKSILQDLNKEGAKKVILKGILTKEKMVGNCIYDSQTGNIEYYFTNRIAKNSHGTGDCFASVITGAVMRGKSLYEATKLAADFVKESIEKTLDDDSHWYGVKFEKAIKNLVMAL